MPRRRCGHCCGVAADPDAAQAWPEGNHRGADAGRRRDLGAAGALPADAARPEAVRRRAAATASGSRPRRRRRSTPPRRRYRRAAGGATRGGDEGGSRGGWSPTPGRWCGRRWLAARSDPAAVVATAPLPVAAIPADAGPPARAAVVEKADHGAVLAEAVAASPVAAAGRAAGTGGVGFADPGRRWRPAQGRPWWQHLQVRTGQGSTELFVQLGSLNTERPRRRPNGAALGHAGRPTRWADASRPPRPGRG